MNLLIVESPTKAKHIQHFLDSDFLGTNWQVKASLGHIRDLERSGDKSYVRPPEFKMNYAITDDKHKEIVAGLKAAAAKAENIFLATDPDREGEAIAWHLCQVLGIKPSLAKRVTYQEVTESAVKKAIATPRNLDMRLVAAQEVRRGLDRMCGWEVSGPLSNVVGTKASAGRVQTPALRLIVEREKAIQAFKPTPFFQIVAHHMPGNWRALWQDGMQAGEYFQDAAFAKALADALPSLPLLVTESESKPTRKAPQPPFTTSSMQMDGARALKCSTDEIMKAAQALFEKGHITYHRTDSPNLSEEGETLLREALEAAGMPLIETPRRWKAKGDAQEAHEAIRPTNPGQIQAGEDATQRSLYDLIRKRALASQMPDAIYQQTSCVLDGGEFQGKPAIFKATGSVMTDAGWRTLYIESSDDDDDQPAEAVNPVPVLQEKTTIKAESGEVLSKSTKAPPRFTESTLIKALESHGVGRPSTYASIIKVLFSRGYIHQKGKAPALHPTEIGEAVIGALAGRFEFADLDWTRQVEDDLDGITAGSINPRVTLQKVWDSLQSGLGNLPAGAVPTTAPCPVDGCSGQVRRMQSQKKPGVFFWACSNKDHGLLSDEKGQPGKTFEEKSEGIGPGPKCEDCDATTRILSTKTGKPYYRCPRCGEAWWTDKARNVLGKRWERK